MILTINPVQQLANYIEGHTILYFNQFSLNLNQLNINLYKYVHTFGNDDTVSFESKLISDAFVIDIIVIDKFPRSIYEKNIAKNIMTAVPARIGINSIIILIQ